jgi:predicted transcriptional regulator
MSTAPISLRLSDKMNGILEMLANELHTTKSKLIKEPTISHEELKRELSL